MTLDQDVFTRLEAILARVETTPTVALENKNAILRWLIEVSGYSQRKSEDLDSAGVEAVSRLPASDALPASLLRVIARPTYHWLAEVPWRPKILQYIDNTIGPRVYTGQVSKDSQSHEKIEHVIHVLQGLEKRFNAAVSDLSSLERIPSCRQAVLSTLNNPHGKAILRPFLPPNIDTSLKELFSRAETYISQRNSDMVAVHFASAVQEADHLSESLTKMGLAYAQSLAEMVQQLASLLRQDFAQNASALPAKLSVNRGPKKYPLHDTQRQHQFSFDLMNMGPGYANDVTILAGGVKPLVLLQESVYIGRLAPHGQYRVDVQGTMSSPATRAQMDVIVEWRDFDGSTHEEMFSLTLPAQRTDVPWEHLAELEPYSLEPVETEEDLVGRQELFQRLVATVKAKNAGSAILYGQKRIGKTSIAKALRSRMQREGHIVVYLEAGDYIAPLPEDTVGQLGATLCQSLLNADSRLADVRVPVFSDALSPLAIFLDQVCRLIPRTTRVVLILDEFDQLPVELYHKTSVGDAFFLSLRSITSRPQVSFIVVGGERMTHILDRQGQQLNKWHSIPIDYFQKESDWSDYRELIQKPTEHTLEFSDEAVAGIYDVSAGNPFFTNTICQRIFEAALRNRDSHVTTQEVDDAIRAVTMSADRNTFQHFWDDGMLETGDQAVERSTRRKKVLLATADVLGRERPARVESIKSEPLLRDVMGVDAEIRELLTRKILVGVEAFDYKVPLFFRWLQDRGVHEVIASFDALDHYTRSRKEEAQKQIGSTEIVELVGAWPSYRGQKITEDRVRSWLSQFSEAREQRVAFTILQGVRFYSNALVREKLQELHGVVDRRVLGRTGDGRKRSDVLVSYLDGVGKSGAQCASLYAEEAKIYVENVVERGRIAEKIMARDNIRALVFVDDFVGTGESITTYMGSLYPPLGRLINERSIAVVIGAVAAFKGGLGTLEQAQAEWPIVTQLSVGDVLEESFCCFGPDSTIFPDQEEREIAKDIALRHGKQLERRCPLGYGDLGLAVVFERGCPNNSLPILWSRSSRWVPLFPRE